MSRKNTTRYAILGMLSTGAQSAYEIQKSMRASINHFWSESDGQLYPALKMLMKEKLLTCTSKTTSGGRAKNIYTLTSSGRAELRRWLKEDIKEDSARVEILLKLFFSHNVNDDVAITHLMEKQKAVKEALLIYRKIEKEFLKEKLAKPEDRYAFLTLQYGIQKAEMLLNWCQSSIKTIKKWRKS